jgi:DNA primase catalytic core
VIPEDVIAEIKKRADIGAIVGRSVKLTKRGRSFVGLCPFHSEKTPSFHVRTDEGYFHCFGCRASGDVVEFLVRSTGRGFLDVVTDLAQETGVVVPQTEMSPAEAEAQRLKKRALRAVELAQMFFRTRLQADEGRAARAYLHDVRKLDDKSIDTFGLGFGGHSDRALVEFLSVQGLSADDGVAAGVLGRSERGAYDFFRQRITIPIRGARGEVTSFGGRVFGAAAEPRTLADGTTKTPPKYVNGPQTVIYDKSSTLYGLSEAQAAWKQGKAAVLVEGYFDVIAVHRSGLATAVAPCGTSLTPRHVEEIKRRVGDAGRVVVCLDADRAGQEAAEKAILMLLMADLDAGIVALPDKDPDQLLQSGRGDELKTLLLQAPSALDHLIARAQRQAAGSLQARVVAVDALLPFLAAPGRALVRAGAVRAAAAALGEDVEVLAREVEQRGRRALAQRVRGEGLFEERRVRVDGRIAGAKAHTSGALVSSSSSSQVDATDRSTSAPQGRPSSAVGPVATRVPPRRWPPLNELEVQLAKIVLCHPELAPRVGLLSSVLSHAELGSFVARVIDALVRFHDIAPREALTKVAVAPRGQLVVLADRVRLDGPDRVLGLTTAMSMLDAITRHFLERTALEERLGALQVRLADADAKGDHDDRKRLLSEQRALVAAMQALAEPPRPLRALVASTTTTARLSPSPSSSPSSLPAPSPAATNAAAVAPVAGSALVAEIMDDERVAVVDEPPWAVDSDDEAW